MQPTQAAAAHRIYHRRGSVSRRKRSLLFRPSFLTSDEERTRVNSKQKKTSERNLRPRPMAWLWENQSLRNNVGDISRFVCACVLAKRRQSTSCCSAVEWRHKQLQRACPTSVDPVSTNKPEFSLKFYRASGSICRIGNKIGKDFSEMWYVNAAMERILTGLK